MEITNKTILHGLKTRLENAKGEWVDQLLHVLWLYRTTPKTATNETLYDLVYRSKAVILVEIGVPTARTYDNNLLGNDEELQTNLDQLAKHREMISIREARYKDKMAKYYNKRVHHTQFRVGDLVLRNNEAS